MSARRELAPSRNTVDAWVHADGPAPCDPVWAGKWLVFVPATDVDRAWVTIRALTIAGDLGTDSKVSTLLNNEENPNARPGHHVICVYTRDCRDGEDVHRVLEGLRRAGFTDKLWYREDGATYAGMYARSGPSSLYLSKERETSFGHLRDPIPAPLEAVAEHRTALDAMGVRGRNPSPASGGAGANVSKRTRSKGERGRVTGAADGKPRKGKAPAPPKARTAGKK